jgi:hypothetical protein
MDEELVPGVEQLARHRLTHLADAEIADPHRSTPVKMDERRFDLNRNETLDS